MRRFIFLYVDMLIKKVGDFGDYNVLILSLKNFCHMRRRSPFLLCEVF